MSHSQAQHAARITARFKALIGQESCTQIGDEHFAELSLIIESAIDSSVLEAERSVLGKLQNIIDETQRDEARTP